MSGAPIENPLVREIVEKYRVLWALGHAMALMGWDSQTYMPRAGNEERGLARAELSVLSRQLLLRPELVELVEKALEAEGLNDVERGIVRVLWREIDRARKVPPEFVYEMAKTAQEANMAWREAREKDDFEIFRPHLERVVELARRLADYLGYEEHPYNALLDLYEEGLTIRDVDSVFDSIIPSSKKVLEKVLADDYYPRSHPWEEKPYPEEAMAKANREVLDLLRFPWERGRLDVSPHPFTISLGIRDVRITTRYEGVDFKRTIYSVVHEFGHALYELQQDERLIATPVVGGASLGVHESQSRFWENIVGRSRAFAARLKAIVDKYLDFTREASEEEMYRYVNTVRPSLIRVDADEVTYNFHIYLRYQLEKMLIAGELKVADLPEVWADMMEELLGVRPRSHKEGVLQDIHWSYGSIGYFPTYTLGNVLAAQIKARLEADLAPVSRLVEEDRIPEIQAWLREKIHVYGKIYPPKTLVEKALGEPMNPEYFNRYLWEKFVEKKA